MKKQSHILNNRYKSISQSYLCNVLIVTTFRAKKGPSLFVEQFFATKIFHDVSVIYQD